MQALTRKEEWQVSLKSDDFKCTFDVQKIIILQRMDDQRRKGWETKTKMIQGKE